MGGNADLIRAGRDALESGDAAAARSHFREAARDQREPEAEEGLALADHLDADYDAAAEKFERAFSAYRDRGDIAGAARCARMLMWITGNLKGDWTLESGWSQRLRSILAQAEEGTAEHGWLLCFRAQTSAPDSAPDDLERALVIAKETGDRCLEHETHAWTGLVAVLAGRVADGMAMLDEALTAILAGEVDDVYVMEGTFCGMLWACEVAHDVARAAQWMRAVEDMRRRRSLPAMAAFCRIHHGAILTAAGRWPEAERELSEALRMFEGTGTRMQAKALIQLADLRVRQGRLEEAERLLEGLDRHPDATRSLAALHFAKGNLALARDVVERGVGEIEAAVDAPLLALLAEVAIAQGETDDARRASARLDGLAGERGGHYLTALAALVRGQVCLATGDGNARGCLDEALASFSQTEMPLEVAQARLVLAEAAATERPEVAIEEAKAALAAFERLEAARHADRAGAMLRRLGAPVRTGSKGAAGALTKRETEVLGLLGAGLPNPEIAERLFITRRTVEHHVANILAKLHLRNRAEAAAFAVRERGA